MLAIASLYFVITGLQFWISDYCRLVLGTPKQRVFIGYSLTSITSPTLGVLFGGKFVDKYGGYTGKHALKICLIFGILAAVGGLPIPF